MRCVGVLIAMTAVAGAEPAPPKQCGASVSITGTADKAHLVGAVKSITASKDDAHRFTVVVGDRSFGMWIEPKPPFAVGQSIDVQIRRGGGFHAIYDALVKDAAGKILLITSGSGGDDWADGWKVTRGKIVESRQDPNQTEQSIERTHALVFARGKTTVTVAPHACVVVKDGAARYLVSGFASSWLGIRPPEGIDYQTFAMVPW